MIDVAVIELDGLTKRFGQLTVVNQLSFAVKPGQVVGFLGPNGAGKTTSLRMLLGLVAPTSGTATIDGQAYAKLPDPLHMVGAALESSLAYPGRTARNHLRIHALAGRMPPSRPDELLDLVELTDAANRRVGHFSLGMRQRLSLATALLCDPQVLILDEPGNGLDPEGIHWLRGLLRGLADEGRTVLVSSHLLAEMAQTVDSVIILDHGRLVANSPLAQLTGDQSHQIRIRTPRAGELAGLLSSSGYGAQVTGTDHLEVSGATAEQVGTLAASHAIPIFETSTQTTDLEDVFLQLIARAGGSEVTQ